MLLSEDPKLFDELDTAWLGSASALTTWSSAWTVAVSGNSLAAALAAAAWMSLGEVETGRGRRWAS